MSTCRNNITLPIGPRGPQGPQGIQGIQGPPGDGGLSLEWLGTFATAPLTPTTNQAYYNSVDKKSYVYNGTTWEIIAQDGVDGANGDPGPAGPPGAGASANIQEEGVTVNTIALTTLNFVGTGATATETSPGVVEVNIPGSVGGGVTAIDGPDAAAGTPNLGEQSALGVEGLPAGTIVDSDTPTADLIVKGAASSNDAGRVYSSSFPTVIANMSPLVNHLNSTGSTKKFLVIANFTVEYNTTGTTPELGNLRIFSGTSNGTNFVYKPGSAQFVGPKFGLFTDLILPVAFMDVISVPNNEYAVISIDLPGYDKTPILGIATITGGGARIVGLNTNIIQLD